MKKIVLASALLATMGIGAFSVYADSGSVNEFDHGYDHMSNNNLNRNKINLDREIFTEEEEKIQVALDEGWITEDEAAERRAEFAERDRLNEEDRFSSRRYHHGGMRKGYRQNRSYSCH